MSKVIAIINPKDGTFKLEVEGIAGESCEEITKAIMQANEVIEHTYTSEIDDGETMPDYIEEVADAMEETLED